MMELLGAERIRSQAQSILDTAGLTGSILVRDLASGVEVGINPDDSFPMASLVKLPLAGALLSAADNGVLDLGATVRLDPATATPGPTGLCRFRYPTTVAVADLLYLAIAISDDTAADSLFSVVPPSSVRAWLDSLDIRSELFIRHPISDIYRSIADRVNPADMEVLHRLIVDAAMSGSDSPLPQLNRRHANNGSARGFVDLLGALWSADSAISATTRSAVRELLGLNVFRHRLAPEFTSERMRWFSKTGSFMNLRHEVGVVEHASGRVIAVAVLTRSSVPAIAQPAAEAAMGRAARVLHDQVLAAM
ncbi:serine hydrolase [Microbacterium sp. 3J1]|uniref:serine hydrolase n=1 Tax=Microbacterium sp. 3J1 TaxID=861269 RepID=UPI001C400619|nr:serine hydrolase [Microbacterium sp. 3J1]